MTDDGRVMTRSRAPRTPLPFVRAALFAVVGTVLGVSAHHLVAEGPVPWRQGGLAALVLFAVGLAGVRRPRSLGSVVAVCGAAQTGLHFWLMTEHAGSAPMAMPGHVHQAAGAHEVWHERLHGSVTMTALHAVAAVVVAVLLHRADAVCWRLARGLSAAVEGVRARVAVVRTLLSGRRPVVPVRPAVILVRLERPPPEGAVLADVVVRRGPPAGFVLAH